MAFFSHAVTIKTNGNGCGNCRSLSWMQTLILACFWNGVWTKFKGVLLHNKIRCLASLTSVSVGFSSWTEEGGELAPLLFSPPSSRFLSLSSQYLAVKKRYSHKTTFATQGYCGCSNLEKHGNLPTCFPRPAKSMENKRMKAWRKQKMGKKVRSFVKSWAASSETFVSSTAAFYSNFTSAQIISVLGVWFES